jgi:signal peptidase II
VTRFFLIAAGVVGLDRLTKWLVVRFLPVGHDVPIVGKWVMLTHIKNTGAAFGLFPGSIPLLVAISVIASIVVIVLARRAGGRPGRLLPLGLILGGALGNLIDRVLRGRVTDFVNVGLPDGARWPVFNVADSGVTIGVTILAFGIYFHHRDWSEEPATPDSTPPTLGKEAEGQSDQAVAGATESDEPSGPHGSG